MMPGGSKFYKTALQHRTSQYFRLIWAPERESKNRQLRRVYRKGRKQSGRSFFKTDLKYCHPLQLHQCYQQLIMHTKTR